MPDDEQDQQPAAAPPADQTPDPTPDNAAPAKRATSRATGTKAAAKKAAAKKAPAKKATATKAPTKKAPAKRAPARKTAAKAPAKAAAGSRAPRASIMNRISELEERFAATPAVQEPVAEDLAVQPVAETPTQAIPVETPAPEPRAARRTPPPVVAELAPPTAALPPLPRAVPPVPVEDAPTTRTPRSDGLARTMLILIALLLAVAAGMGAAAYVKNRPATWRAQSVVEITAPAATSASDETAVARRRYQTQVNSNSFTGGAAALAGVNGDHVKSLITAKQGKAGQLVLVAKAASPDEASRLAEGASRQLGVTVLEDQRSLLDPAQRMGTKVITPTSPAVKDSPRTRSIWLAAALGAVDVLLVALMVGVFGTRPRRRGRR